ncbi:MAG: beta-N-acetylhexosaminidase [Bacteroidales bacterium]|nr:beta-N-acetylhexosaminidase [Bacteroidales bacterium]
MKDYLRLKYTVLLLSSLFLLFSCAAPEAETTTALFNEGIYLIPYPQEVTLGGEDFVLGEEISVVLDGNTTDSDRFAATDLIAQLKKEWGIDAVITGSPSGKSIILTHEGVSEKVAGLPEKKALQGYQLTTEADQLIIRAKGESGLFYGTRTLLQIIKKGPEGLFVPGMEITDWPDIPERAGHYDTKHHQDKRAYVESFIRDLARYKINMLVWEWEDKFAYPSHPEIGAPGAFTMEEMQEITRYAKKYHVQLVPLVQGLGHVSFILKWPQYNHLREVPASNWEFCPLKEGSYELLFDLWEDAIEATPGSEYIHIGSDETYELGVCEQCRTKSEEIGKSGLYHLFTGRAGKHLHAKGRKVMCWERPMGWIVGDSPAKGIEPFEELVLTESYSYETPDFKYAREAKAEGFEIFSYDPNPAVTPLMVSYLYARGEDGKTRIGSLEKSYHLLTSSTKSGYFDGMINTSWDDAGLHNQMWMMSFINSAEWTWSGNNPGLEEFTDKFFLNYYGEQSGDMRELYLLMNKAAYYYFESFERRVWHYGDIGKTHLPVLPRGDNLEYDEYWNREYSARIQESSEQIKQMDRAMEIIRANQDAGVKNSYDLELFTTIAELVSHTCNTYLALSELERAIKEAHNQRFVSHQAAYDALGKAVDIIETNLSERQKVYEELVAVWEKTRLPKGLSTEDKEFFHRQDRARHFAFRRADMSYLICDEELLGLEDYREKLLEYMEWYKKTYLF